MDHQTKLYTPKNICLGKLKPTQNLLPQYFHLFYNPRIQKQENAKHNMCDVKPTVKTYCGLVSVVARFFTSAYKGGSEFVQSGNSKD